MKRLRKMALVILFSNYRQDLHRKTEKSALCHNFYLWRLHEKHPYLMIKWVSALDDLENEQENAFKIDKICFITTSCQRESGSKRRLMSHH